MRPELAVSWPRANTRTCRQQCDLLPVTTSVALRQPEDALGDEVQDHPSAHRRDARNHRLAEIALDEIFFRIAHAAVREHGRLARPEPRFGAQILCGVRFRATILAGVIKRRRL